MTFWRGLFAFAAFVNLAVGGGMMAASSTVAERLGVTGPGAPFAIFMIGMMIAVFGVGYAIVARDPARNRALVWIGIIGKSGAVAIGAAQYAAGALPFSTFTLSMGDAVFAALFALFLWKGPRAPNRRRAISDTSADRRRTSPKRCRDSATNDATAETRPDRQAWWW